eukprot:Hpha_TRINITY_DN15534_c0_g3::TRINITY_DN15534_c0_g3_i1::g.106519::m.106519
MAANRSGTPMAGTPRGAQIRCESLGRWKSGLRFGNADGDTPPGLPSRPVLSTRAWGNPPMLKLPVAWQGGAGDEAALSSSRNSSSTHRVYPPEDDLCIKRSSTPQPGERGDAHIVSSPAAGRRRQQRRSTQTGILREPQSRPMPRVVAGPSKGGKAGRVSTAVEREQMLRDEHAGRANITSQYRSTLRGNIGCFNSRHATRAAITAAIALGVFTYVDKPDIETTEGWRKRAAARAARGQQYQRRASHPGVRTSSPHAPRRGSAPLCGSLQRPASTSQERQIERRASGDSGGEVGSVVQPTLPASDSSVLETTTELEGSERTGMGNSDMEERRGADGESDASPRSAQTVSPRAESIKPQGSSPRSTETPVGQRPSPNVISSPKHWVQRRRGGSRRNFSTTPPPPNEATTTNPPPMQPLRRSRSETVHAPSPLGTPGQPPARHESRRRGSSMGQRNQLHISNFEQWRYALATRLKDRVQQCAEAEEEGEDALGLEPLEPGEDERDLVERAFTEDGLHSSDILPRVLQIERVRWSRRRAREFAAAVSVDESPAPCRTTFHGLTNTPTMQLVSSVAELGLDAKKCKSAMFGKGAYVAAGGAKALMYAECARWDRKRALEGGGPAFTHALPLRVFVFLLAPGDIIKGDKGEVHECVTTDSLKAPTQYCVPEGLEHRLLPTHVLTINTSAPGNRTASPARHVVRTV